MVGIPTDVYLTGTMQWWMVVATGIGSAIGALCYASVFSELGIVSVNQVILGGHFLFCDQSFLSHFVLAAVFRVTVQSHHKENFLVYCDYTNGE